MSSVERAVRVSLAFHYDQVGRIADQKFKNSWTSSTVEALDHDFLEFDFIYGNSFANGFAAKGIDAVEYVFDNPYSASLWAKINNYEGLDLNKIFYLKLEAFLYDFKPDLVLFQDASYLTVEFLSKMKSYFPFVKHFFAHRGYPGGDVQALKVYHFFDHVFCGGPHLLEKFQRLGVVSSLMYHAFDPACFSYRKEPGTKRYPLSFYGTTGSGRDSHNKRMKLIQRLYSEFPDFHCFTDDYFVWELDKAGNPKKLMAAKLINELTKISPQITNFKNLGARATSYLNRDKDRQENVKISKSFANRTHPGVYGKELYETIDQTLISINLHSDVSLNYAENMRMFQVTGMGGCMITNDAINMDELFEKDTELLTFKTNSELFSKLKELTNNSQLCRDIGDAAKKRVNEQHTYGHRCDQILNVTQNPSRHESRTSYLPHSPPQKNLYFTKKKTMSNSLSRTLTAVYDLELHPISFDVTFFCAASQLHMQQLGYSAIDFVILPLKEQSEREYPDGYDEVIGSKSREYRVENILVDVPSQFKYFSSNLNFSSRDSAEAYLSTINPQSVFPSTNDQSPPAHHRDYFTLVNKTPHQNFKNFGVEPQAQAEVYVRHFLLPSKKPIVSFTVREYAVDEGRNSNLLELAKICEFVKKRGYEVVIIPDTDNYSGLRGHKYLWRHVCLPAAFNIALRTAIYGMAEFNLFGNTGPNSLALLNPNSKFIFYNIVNDDIHLTSREFLHWLGFDTTSNPLFASPDQHWCWNMPEDADAINECIERVF